MSRPKSTETPTRLTVRFYDMNLEQLDALAKAFNLRRGDVVRQAVSRWYLNETALNGKRRKAPHVRKQWRR